ncbi:MAG: 5-nucleotidase, partial [Acidobacteria bacterium]|nr:5-nucleotidase [Acidobacteriota bacterium]
MRRLVAIALAPAWLWLVGASEVPRRAPASDQPARVTLSIVGTSDLHGAALPSDRVGGLPLLAGYVNNLRAARASDAGAVLLL